MQIDPCYNGLPKVISFPLYTILDIRVHKNIPNLYSRYSSKSNCRMLFRMLFNSILMWSMRILLVIVWMKMVTRDLEAEV